MILQLEKLPECMDYEDQDMYIEDEVHDSDEMEMEDNEFGMPVGSYSDVEYEQFCKIKHAEKETKDHINILYSSTNLCLCEINKNLSAILRNKFNLEKLTVQHHRLLRLKDSIMEKFDRCIEFSKRACKIINNEECHHKRILNSDLEMCLASSTDPTKVKKYVDGVTKKIKKNLADRVVNLAPAEKGQWINWNSDVFLEEKLFPSLFPYGVGGYLSSNMLRQNDMGFSNYIKNRLLSADPRFRNDASYLFFLLLVKELIDMKRSQQTVFRKANKASNLTAQSINEIGKENLFRYDTAFTTFKNIRGTAPYYQDVKKKLIATIRQKGPPTLFTTFSCAEYDWKTLIKQIYETKYKRSITLEEVEDLSVAEKNKLVNENVVQSTMHFSKRTDKLFSILTKDKLFEHNGDDFGVDSYFYRVEFQARGAPHIHCLLWLQSSSGEEPPNMWNDEKDDLSTSGQKIADFVDSIISGSSDDMSCDNHEKYNNDCLECKELKQLVEKYQSHSHTFSCRKKNKIIRINSNEGHGRLDGKIEGDVLNVKVCRLQHPKYPIDKTTFIQAFPSDTDKEIVRQAKKDYEKIRKFMLRLTSKEDFRNSGEWKSFIELSFREFLYEIGLYPEGKKIGDPDDFASAKKRYLTGLRCGVKSTGMLILRRKTSDIFTNNYNKHLLTLHQANQDIQYIFDEYAVIEYICNYLLKNESGVSPLLKSINEEALKDGEKLSVTIKKIGKMLDKGREMSIQEGIYRALGLSMTKFSDVVRFISTTHPDRREGLLKPNYESLDDEESIFHNSFHNYYELRPDDSDYWDELCLADFASHYNICYGKSKSKNAIQLLDEKYMIQKRKRPCVLRYYLRYDSDEEYLRALCILFLPFRDETREIHLKDVTKVYVENEEIIERNRRKYERHQAIVEIIKEKTESKKDDLDDIEEEEEEADTNIEEETTTNEEIDDFVKSMKSEAKKTLTRFKANSDLLPDDEYLEVLSKLNNEQRTIFDDFNERLMFHQDEPFYLYIGGNAGTGKSFLMRAMINAVKRKERHSGI